MQTSIKIYIFMSDFFFNITFLWANYIYFLHFYEEIYFFQESILIVSINFSVV